MVAFDVYDVQNLLYAGSMFSKMAHINSPNVSQSVSRMSIQEIRGSGVSVSNAMKKKKEEVAMKKAFLEKSEKEKKETTVKARETATTADD